MILGLSTNSLLDKRFQEVPYKMLENNFKKMLEKSCHKMAEVI